jgi:hypothetical protein
MMFLAGDAVQVLRDSDNLTGFGTGKPVELSAFLRRLG